MLSEKQLWTKERIVTLLESNPRAVERAVLAIYARQTLEEQHSETTKENNGRGFRHNHRIGLRNGLEVKSNPKSRI